MTHNVFVLQQLAVSERKPQHTRYMMNFKRASVSSHGSHFTPKFIDVYSKLFQGISPQHIAPHQDSDRFFSDLLDLKVDRSYLEGELNRISKDMCLGRLKVRYH